jgi:hypothetical protein
MKLSVIIAVYNEAATVGTLLERVWARRGRHPLEALDVLQTLLGSR